MTKSFDEMNAEKIRRVCEAMDRENGRRKLSERERQILDMWPRFEDGEPVWYGDEVDNMRSSVIAVEFFDGSITLSSDFDHLHLRFGERVKRPAPKVLDADGVEIKVGDTVWHHSGFAHGVVTSIDASSLMGTVRYVNGGVEFRDAAKDLTHTRPDSWERLEEDAGKDTCVYFGGTEHFDCSECPSGKVNCFRHMKLDLIRRAKALAGVEVDE